MKTINWKKCAIYNFIEWVKDTKEDKKNAYTYNELDILTTNLISEEDINDYITSCYYEYEDYKDIEEFTLEELEQFLKEVFL